ncbi:MAG: endopeptidase La [Bacilli bacterium]|nr:endopeptidase La [Bacilli bacterium]
MRYDLSTIVLKGLVLLPFNELKTDIKINMDIIESAKLFDNNKVLVVTDIDTIEETIDISKLPNVGTIAYVKQAITLPNGLVRITLKGLSRANVIKYSKIDDIEAVVKENKDLRVSNENIIMNKIKKELNEYITLPNTSNSFLNDINDIKSLSVLTDIVAFNISSSAKRLLEYLTEIDPIVRSTMILEDIYKLKEMYQVEQNLDIKLQKKLDDNQKEFFLREKIKLIKQELGDISIMESDYDDLKIRLNNLNAPICIKERIAREIKRYSMIPASSPELSMIRNYIECMLSLPWNNVTFDNDDLLDVREKLDKTHDGLEKVKSRIIEYLGVKKVTNSINGPILCLVGPPGVGKTTLAFSIADAMNRKFAKISVGGINDEAEIIGHRRTYLGASPGRIINQIKKCGSSNPVFLIDEIDKMTSNYKGDPASVMLEVLDQNQNKFFKDNFIEEEYDLSRVMFILTANYIEDIPEALRDRLEIVNLSGYTEYEKLDIARNYLIPKICKDHGLNPESLVISDTILLKIIRNYTKEAGVRELERKLSSIVRKIITSLSDKRISKNKITVTNKLLEEYLGNIEFENNVVKKAEVGVVNALFYTKFGGDVLPIEVTKFKGSGNITLTGSLGSVIKESAIVALDYIKANYSLFNIEYSDIINYDIHIHIPNGAIPKEGPSAGIAITTALISLFTNKKVDSNIAFTGEISLKGHILPIGGLKEKSIGAMRAGVKKIYLPYNNKSDLIELPSEVKENIEFIFVKDYKEVFKGVLS